jgi:SUN domain-containing protein 1/2
LERILPNNMVVKKNARGSVDIDPVFWSELRKMLVGKGEVESMVRDAMAGIKVPETFEAEREFESWGEKLFARKAKEGVFMSRDEFLRLLDTEVTILRSSIDAIPRQPAQSTGSPVIKSNGEDVTSALQDLIDAALLRYSKDTIARPDYALFTAGARVVPSITSDTLLLRNVAKSRWLLWGEKNVQGRSPATALHPDNSVGSCWPFEGAKGQLGVLLNRRVRVGDITIEHAARDIAMDVSTAPRNIEVVSYIDPYLCIDD